MPKFGAQVVVIENETYIIASENDILGITNYHKNFVSAVHKKNIFGVQFHPEKSHYFGKKFLEIFLDNK